MLKNLLLLIFGIISLIAILDFFKITHILCRCDLPLQCNDAGRYDTTLVGGGGTAITNDSATKLEDNFKTKYVDSVQRVTACYFSKKAIDHLFAHHPRANAIGCSYALENDSLKIIINTYRISQTEIDIPPELDSTNVVSKTLCPNVCPYAK